MSSSLNQRFTPWSLLKFAAPSIVMMVFMSLYTIVDGIFVSRFVGSNALSATNIVYPVLNIAIAFATMLATGGNAIISRYLGEDRPQKANACLTQYVVIALGLGVLISILVQIFATPLSLFLGANDVLLHDCNMYLRTLLAFAPACMLQVLFQSYFVTAERPTLGLLLSIGSGISNAVLDYLFIVVFQLGVAGAALATGIGQCIPAVVGLIFFFTNKQGLHFTKFSFYKRELLQACYNGSSELVSQLSMAVVTALPENTVLLPLPFYYTANFCLIRSISVFLLALRPLSDFNTARKTRSCSGAYTGFPSCLSSHPPSFCWGQQKLYPARLLQYLPTTQRPSRWH